MKPAKWWFVISAAVLCLVAVTVLAADKAQTLQRAAEKLEAVASESQLKKVASNVGLFKEAGLSYQPSLVVPVEGVVGCKDNEQLRMLIGMYTFDANYALLFGNKQAFAAANDLRNNIPDRLNLRGKLNSATFTSAEIKQVVDNPDDPANHDLYVKYASANFHDMLVASKSDPEMMALLVDAGYGAVIEGLYISSKLALATGTGPKLVALFNAQAVRLDKLHQVLVAYAEDPELDTLAKRAQRERVVKPVARILKAKKGNLKEADVKKILSLTEPVRSEVASKCE